MKKTSKYNNLSFRSSTELSTPKNNICVLVCIIKTWMIVLHHSVMISKSCVTFNLSINVTNQYFSKSCNEMNRSVKLSLLYHKTRLYSHHC